ncbi:Clavaminate synthase-like protein [Mycena latifolia]|nr:Clavaminate synthase-like protein [Mycena latifolia]
MTIELSPLPLPASADASKFTEFGREVKNLNPGTLSPQEFEQVKEALYKHDVLLFRNALLTPEQQYALTKAKPDDWTHRNQQRLNSFQAFDPESESYGHGNNKTGGNAKSILHPDLKTIPRVPQAPEPHHVPQDGVSPEDEAQGVTRFYRWHIDAALYDLSPPRVTTLYGITVPSGSQQTCRYDDGTGDELPVPLGTTAFVSGKTMFEILPAELKSLAVRSRVKYAPHPYVWMAPAHAMSTGLGIESEGLELRLDELPPWEEAKMKILPLGLHFQVHPCGGSELLVDPLPAGANREGALYPDGGHITDLKEVRQILYKMQRPAIAPTMVYPHDWSEKDLVLFHNRGVLHTVVGAFSKDQVRAFHQCNLAASDDPVGPTTEDVEKWC